MQEFIINVFIYTFATFGIIIFFAKLLIDFRYPKTNNKLIYIYDGNSDNFEVIFREIMYLVKDKRIASNVYILFQNSNNTNIDRVLKKVANNNNISLIFSEKELIEIL